MTHIHFKIKLYNILFIAQFLFPNIYFDACLFLQYAHHLSPRDRDKLNRGSRKKSRALPPGRSRWRGEEGWGGGEGYIVNTYTRMKINYYKPLPVACSHQFILLSCASQFQSWSRSRESRYGI